MSSQQQQQQNQQQPQQQNGFSIDPNVISTTRLSTPPLKGRSLMGVVDGEIAPHFSLLLHPDADVDAFQHHIENSHKSTIESSSSLPQPQQQQQQPQEQENYGQLISKDIIPVPDFTQVVHDANELNNNNSNVDPTPKYQHQRIQDTTNQIISPSTLHAARLNQTTDTNVSNPEAVAAALNFKIIEDGQEHSIATDEQRLQNVYQHTVSIRGICKAQSLVRGYLARMRARKQLMLQAWKELDTKEEQELSFNNNQYRHLRSLVDNDTALQSNLNVGNNELDDEHEDDDNTIIPEYTTQEQQQHHQQIKKSSPSQSPQHSPKVTPKQPSPSPERRTTQQQQQQSSNEQNNNSSLMDSHDDTQQTSVVVDETQHQLILSKPALSTTSSRGVIENGLYRPASGLSFGDDDGRVSLSDLQLPQNAVTKRANDDEYWVDKVQTRMQHLRVLREFREHAVPHPSSIATTINNTSQQDIGIDWNAIDNITKEDKDFFYQQAPHFRSRLQDGYRIPKSLIDRYPRANLRLITSDTPIDLDWVHLLRDELAGGKIPIAPIVERLILLTFSILCKEPNVQDVTVPLNGKVTVVGDIHGQLADLLSIFRLNGIPSASNVYVFNGDWVDRGSQSIEVLLLLLSWKALYPSYVFLNRGNHEAADINSRDGFEKECKDKYGVGIFPLFSELFSAVPIACRIFGSANDIPTSTTTDQQQAQQKPAIFVTHGGIPQKGLTIEQIQKENRFYTIPYPNSIIFNMLWSDPSPYKGTYPSSRGAGYEFGPDVTLDFLRSNRCCMLIRSHECVDQGWQLSHHNMCLTVFSASNYQKSVGNQGGYCIIESSLRPTLVTFYAEASNQLATRSSVRFKRLETSVIQKLMDRIAIHRLDLISYFNRIAQENVERAKRGEIVEALNTNAALPCSDQIISRQQWADGLREVLGVNIPFLLFQEQLGLPDRGVLGDERGPINYMAFLTPFTPKNDLFKSIDTQASTDIQHRRPASPGSSPRPNVSRLQQPSSTTDSIPNGDIISSSFYESTTTTTTSSSSSSSMSPSVSSLLTYDQNGKPILTPEISRIALTQLSQLLYSHRYEVENVFRFLDLDNNRTVTRDEFITGIYNLIVLFRAKVTKMRLEKHPDCETYANNASLLLEIDWDKNNLQYFADIVDNNNDGEIQYDEFMTHFQFDAQKLAASIVENRTNFCSALVKNTHHVVTTTKKQQP